MADAQTYSFSGCGAGPYTSCVDPIPATYVSGSWIETDSSSEWTLTGNYAPPGGQGAITGTVLVFPPADAYTCPVFRYTANGYFDPTVETSGVESSTGFIWIASNPSPNITCSGYTPVSSMEFHNVPPPAAIVNKGNDYGTGTWTNSSNVSGPLAIETNLILTPTAESLYAFTLFDPNGWGGNSASPFRTQLDLMQSLQDTSPYDPEDPNFNEFQGRQVYESANGLVTDSCYDSVPSNYKPQNPTPRASILGSVWNVGWGWGEANDYGPDTLGFSTASINWYRAHLPASAIPCTIVIPQAMNIVNAIPAYANEEFVTHTLSWTIGTNTVTVKKDDYTVSRAY
jgi:hypothetical protein